MSGECDFCGEFSSHLKDGSCLPCSRKYISDDEREHIDRCDDLVENLSGRVNE